MPTHEPSEATGVADTVPPSTLSSARAPRPTKRRDILRRAARTGLAALTVISLLGCTTTYQEFVEFQEGWRTAEVLEVGAANTLQRRGITDCRESATAGELQTRRFAAVGYRAGGRPHVHIVILGADSALRRGDRVFLNVQQCGGPITLKSPIQMPSTSP